MLVRIPDNGDPAPAPGAVPNQEDNRDRATGTFLACLNHEVRTPLSGIIGMVDLLLETELDEEQREYVQAARACAENLSEILNSTLEYSALEAGQYALDTVEFNIREMLEAALGIHQPKAESKGLKIRLEVDSTVPETMTGDGVRIKELLGHLLSNAVKFTHAGQVELSAAVESGHLSFRVSDTGVGIPPDRLSTIFESFRQGETGLLRAYAGMGLGLAVAQKLASLMRASIHVESQIGRGSTFRVDVPMEAQPGHRSPRFEQTQEDAGQGPWILAVDDNPVGLKVLRHMLTRRGFHIECCLSGPAALEAARTRSFDLVLMDLQMPEMDGLTASIELRKIPGYAFVPILALTANYSDQVREQCRAHGMQAFLTKPVESDELLGALNRFLERETVA